MVHVQLGQILDNKIQKDQKSSTATSEDLGAKTVCHEQKPGPAHAPCTQHHHRDGQTPEDTLLS